MPYQRSTQASGFRSRKGPDISKQLRQYATALDTQRKENVKGMERQGVQLSNEMNRIDSLAAKKDVYELQNLKEFSSTVENFLSTVASDVIKPVFDQQIEDGVTLGVKYQQGDPDAIAKIDANDEQLAEIEDRINKQAIKTSQTVEAIRLKWEKEGKITSLEEEYRLQNIKKLGSNSAFGFRKGLLMESATGFEAFRDSALLYNEDNELSTENIGTEDDPIIIGNYHRYTGEDGQEKKKAILGYVTNKYIVEKGKESGLSESFINKYLTRPILEQNSKFQQQEAKTARLELAAAASENNKEAIILGIDAYDTDNGESFRTAVQSFLLTEPGNLRGQNTAGSKVLGANDVLLETVITKLAGLDLDTQEDILNLLETSKFNVPGITKEGQPQTLSEIWSDKFNIDELKVKLTVETGKQERLLRESLKNEAAGEITNILKDYHKHRSDKIYNKAVLALQNNPKYIGVLEADFFTNAKSRRDSLSYNLKKSNSKMKELRNEYGDNPIPFNHAVLDKLHPDVYDEGVEKGWIAEDIFAGDNEAKNAHNTNSKARLEQLKKVLSLEAGDYKWSDENDQVAKASALIDTTLRKYTKGFLDLNEGKENYTLSMAVAAANAQLDKEIKADLAGEVLPTGDGGVRSSVWSIGADGFENIALNAQYEQTATSPLDQAQRIVQIVDTASRRIKLSHHADIFSDKNAKPVVKIEDFDLDINGEVSQVWEQLSAIDPLGRTPEMLWELQAAKFSGIEIPEWSDTIKQEIADWEQLNPKLRRMLSSGDFNSAGRALQEIGVLDLNSTINSVLTNQDKDFLIKEEELPSILNALGLKPMTLDELKADPQLLKLAMKKKILNITEEVQAITTDQNQAIRMVFAGIKFGDIKEWNNPYTLAALNTYYSGDTTALDKLNSTFNMNPWEKGIELQGSQPIDVYDTEIPWDITAIDNELAKLNANRPPETVLLDSDLEGKNWFQTTFAPPTQPNPAYQAYMVRKQKLNDMKRFMNIAENGFGTGLNMESSLKSGRRLLGEQRFNEIQDLVLAKYPDAKINEKTNMIGYSYKDATQMFAILVANEVGAPGSTGNIVGDTSGDLKFDISEYTLDNPLISGKVPKEDLVQIKGYSVDGSGEVIQVRQDAAVPLESMMDQAAKDGILLNFSSQKTYNSGYRPIEQQIKAKQSMIKAGTPDLAAEPGSSTHGLGTGFDFYIEDEATLNWLKENGPKYGFFPYSPRGEGKPDFDLQLGANDEHWHWDYRPELMENN